MAKKNESNEELLEEIARLKAELGQKEQAVDDSAYDGEELVDYMAPIIGPGDQDMKPMFVGVNGETIRIKPGVPVRIKKKFLDALEHANDQRIAAWNFMKQQQDEGRKKLSEM
jgi:hypothetical protein